MKIFVTTGLFALAVFAELLIRASPSARGAQANESSGVLTLVDAMGGFGKLISGARVTATAHAGTSFNDPPQVDRAVWTQSKFRFDQNQPCLITFDEITALHYLNDPSVGNNAGKTVESGERHFIWLPAMKPDQFKVLDLEVWANDDELTDSSVPSAQDATYHGFVLTIDPSSEVITVAPIKHAFS